MGFGGGGSGSAGGGILEGVEQSSTPDVDNADSGGSVVGQLHSGNQITLPAIDKAYKITAVEWKNGLGVAGSIIAGVYISDVAPPTSVNVQVIAYAPSTVQAGADQSVQKVNVISDTILMPSSKITGFIIPDNALARWRGFTVGAQNLAKAGFGSLVPPKPVDTIAWTASTIRAYVKIYFKVWT